MTMTTTSETFHVIDLDDREHHLGVRLPGGEAVVLDLRACRGRLVVYLSSEVTLRRIEGGDGGGCPRAPGPSATEPPR